MIRGVERMSTESVDISGATESLEQDVSLAETDSRVEWLGTVHGVAPKVRVSIEVLPRQDQRVVELAVYDVLARKLGTTRVEPIEPVRVSIRGNARDLRELPMRDVPVFLDVVPESRAREDGTLGVEIFIRWSPAVPEGLGSRLQIEPAQTRILARIVPLVEVDEHEHGPGGDEPVDDSTSSKSSTN